MDDETRLNIATLNDTLIEFIDFVQALEKRVAELENPPRSSFASTGYQIKER